MRRVSTLLGVLLVITGGVWTLQGLNVLPGSFMTGDPTWTRNGLVALVVGLGLTYLGLRRTSS